MDKSQYRFSIFDLAAFSICKIILFIVYVKMMQKLSPDVEYKFIITSVIAAGIVSFIASLVFSYISFTISKGNEYLRSGVFITVCIIITALYAANKVRRIEGKIENKSSVQETTNLQTNQAVDEFEIFKHDNIKPMSPTDSGII